MLVFRRNFSRFINNNTPKRGVRKVLHKNVTQYKYTPNSNIVNQQNDNNKLVRGGGGLLSTFYESFIYGCGFFLSNRLLDQIFGPRSYDSFGSNMDYSNENVGGQATDNYNSYPSENLNNNDPSINDNDFQQDIGLDDDTFDF
ncbi:hypothetical protein PCYB_011070 [Plasmodium cynomolgi strain B]|uniref:Uncharacterized protein n=1 Tax=Plasmodium cynomolgi (strain B) TaxID=1120755 RepID=K6UP82_PLACD|nr:hypothetical protein PCYB_011070 [Plasmodium cynomolgi strain B]GAB64374.1 hypothetical protein PCYB_011070 [Plasmodium cynomolgi strain B]